MPTTNLRVISLSSIGNFISKKGTNIVRFKKMISLWAMMDIFAFVTITTAFFYRINWYQCSNIMNKCIAEYQISMFNDQSLTDRKLYEEFIYHYLFTIPNMGVQWWETVFSNVIKRLQWMMFVIFPSLSRNKK